MRVVVLTPWRSDDGPRERLWKATGPEIRELGFAMYRSDSGDDPFSVARSYNHASKMAGKWDMAVLYSADVWVPAGQIHKAIDKAVELGRLTYAWDRCLSLSESATDKFVDGQRSFEGSEVLKVGVPPGGPRVITRKLWDTFGGFDPRFVGWGSEDWAFRHMAEVMGGVPARIEGPLIKLRHPKDHPSFYANRADNWNSFAEIARHRTPGALQAYLAQRHDQEGECGCGLHSRFAGRI